MPRTAITQLAKLIGQELESRVGPSEQALATGPLLAEAGATTEIVERLFAEVRRKRPNDWMIQAYPPRRLAGDALSVHPRRTNREYHRRLRGGASRRPDAPEWFGRCR
jgi:hypothetical protein